MTTLYPLALKPYYRHGGETPWGGHALRDALGRDIPDDTTGESLDISALPGMESMITNGALAGQPLSAALEKWGKELTGLDEPGFPLLVKLIDARETLSVQVHPGDAYARAHEQKRGKTEAWVVLSAPRGAQLVYGLNDTGAPFAQALKAGQLESALNWVPVMPGDVFYIPHGLVHAIGGAQGGSDPILYEIQQSSDVTYRLWDWGRVGADGAPRELHTQKALDVIREHLRPGKVAGATMIVKGGSVTAYISNPYFELTRLNVAGTMPLEAGRMRLLTALGALTLRWADGSLMLGPGESAVVPAALEGVSVEGRLPVLCASTPDQAALRSALGYRAVAVAGIDEAAED